MAASGGEVAMPVSESSGGRVDAHRALKPRAKEGGRVANRWVWKLRV